MLDNRKDYGDITIIYGARSPKDLCYIYEFDQWRAGGANLVLTVDSEFPGWKERVGFVPTVVTEEAPSPHNRVAILCGPPIMIKFVLSGLKQLGFEDRQIVTTLERRMKCGIGICGRCNIGTKYVCLDGPVFTCDQMSEMVQEFSARRELMLLGSYEKEYTRLACGSQFDDLIVHLNQDIGEALPYLNAVLEGVQYTKEPRSVSFRVDGKLVVVYPRQICINAPEDHAEGDRITEWVRQKINDTWERREEIEPRFESPQKPKMLEILKCFPRPTAASAVCRHVWSWPLK